MKRFFTIIFVFCMIFSLLSIYSIPVAAIENMEQVKTDSDWQYIIKDDNTIQIKKYIGSLKQLNIPSEIDGRIINSIASTAFYNSKIEQVNFSDSITDIGWWSFYGCKNLKEVCFGKKIISIGYGAFMNCPQLKKADIPISVNFIGEDAFAVNCRVRKNVNDIYTHRKISTQEYVTDTLFEIFGYSGTYAEKYALENSLAFISKGIVKYGDADSNGVVDFDDIKLIKNYIDGKAELSDFQICCADVDNDFLITTNDEELIKNYIMNKIPYYSFPVSKYLNVVPDYLTGKSIYCDGDSIAKGTGTNIKGNTFYSYCHYISEKYNMTMVNNAVAGTTIAKQKNKTKDKNKSILERVTQMRGDYDIVLLDGGFNDLFQHIDPGHITPEEDKSGNYNEYTTAGALESICYFLQNNYKDSLKLFVLGHKRIANPDQYKYWNIIKQVLDKWNIDYIDLSRETQLCDVNDEISTQYFMFKNGKGDGIHPLTYANNKIYGPCVAKKLNEMAQNRTGLCVNEKEITMGFLEKYNLDAQFTESVSNFSLRWSSDDENIIRVDENGLAAAQGVGSTFIRVCSDDGKTASVKVNVKLMPVNLKLNKTKVKLEKGKTFLLNSTVIEGTASLVKHYASSDKSIAEVDESNGLITAKSPGTAVITCHTSNGVKAECTVTVC